MLALWFGRFLYVHPGDRRGASATLRSGGHTMPPMRATKDYPYDRTRCMHYRARNRGFLQCPTCSVRCVCASTGPAPLVAANPEGRKPIFDAWREDCGASGRHSRTGGSFCAIDAKVFKHRRRWLESDSTGEERNWRLTPTPAKAASPYARPHRVATPWEAGGATQHCVHWFPGGRVLRGVQRPILSSLLCRRVRCLDRPFGRLCLLVLLLLCWICGSR